MLTGQEYDIDRSMLYHRSDTGDSINLRTLAGACINFHSDMKSVLPVLLSLLLASCTPPAKELRKSAMQKMEHHDYNGAIEDWNKYIEQKGQDARAYNSRGLSE